ncbi:MAG TPA: hypothetical protein VNO81_07750, partial [Candidatus Nitrosotenuis sp.]|nr:hypothetical protein [Candidatus Nitrosotenuis sp.]
GIGVAAAALRRAIDKDSAPPPRLGEAERRSLADFAGGAALTGTALGAGLGAFMGVRAGQAELGNQEIHRRSWMAPVMQSKYLGEIPRDHYDWFWPYHDDWGRGSEPVYRQAPVYNADGSVRMQEVSQEFRTGRYGPVAGGILGGLIGAGAGLAAGVAAGVAARLAAEGRAARKEAA